MDDLKDRLEKAKEFFKNEDYEEAEELYRECLNELRAQGEEADSIFLVKSLVGLGGALREQLIFKEAIPFYEEAFRLDPKSKKAVEGLANSYRGLKNWDKSREYSLVLLSLQPDDYLVMTRIADAYRKQRDYKNAEHYYVAALEINPKNKFALMGLGDLYYKNKKYNKALSNWKKLLEINPKFINILTMVGNIYRIWKQYDKAIEYYQRAAELQPDNFYALYGIADSLRGKGRYKDSIKYWNKILRNEPENERIMTRLGDCYIRVGKFKKAEEAYAKVLENSHSRFATIGMIRVKMELGEQDAAVEFCRQYLSKNSGDSRVVLLLAKIYEEMGEHEKSTEIYEENKHVFKDKKEFTSRLASSTIESFEDAIDELD